MLKGFTATCFGSCTKSRRKAIKVLKKSWYVKHLIFYSIYACVKILTYNIIKIYDNSKLLHCGMCT
jgi:hypothetical protein